MQALHDKGSMCCGNCDRTLHSIIFCYGLEIFVYVNRILTKLGLRKLLGPVIMNQVYITGIQHKLPSNSVQTDYFVACYSA